jgi:transposase-like protein
MSRSGRPYPPEFHQQMVELVHAGRSPEELARQFEPTAQSIRNWVAQAARDVGRGGCTTVHGASNAPPSRGAAGASPRVIAVEIRNNRMMSEGHGGGESSATFWAQRAT